MSPLPRTAVKARGMLNAVVTIRRVVHLATERLFSQAKPTGFAAIGELFEAVSMP